MWVQVLRSYSIALSRHGGPHPEPVVHHAFLWLSASLDETGKSAPTLLAISYLAV